MLLNNSNLQKLANEVKIQRSKRGWTQSQLSMISKVSNIEIIKIEGCKLNPRPTTLIKLANALGIQDTIFLKYLD